MQRIWRRRLDWDHDLPAEIKREFWHWVDQLQDLAAVSVPRWYAVDLVTWLQWKRELNVLCDASEKAFRLVTYLRCTSKTGRTEDLVASLAAFIKKATGSWRLLLDWLDGFAFLDSRRRQRLEVVRGQPYTAHPARVSTWRVEVYCWERKSSWFMLERSGCPGVVWKGFFVVARTSLVSQVQGGIAVASSERK